MDIVRAYTIADPEGNNIKRQFYFQGFSDCTILLNKN